MPKHPHYPHALVECSSANSLLAEGWQPVQVDLDPEAYGQGHLPGAISWKWEAQLRNAETQEILNREEFEELMSSSGISSETPILLYGDNNNWFACWAFWLLNLYGHENVRLIDGGIRVWMQSGLPLSTDAPSPRKVPYSAKAPDLRDKAETEDIFKAFFSPTTHCLVDVRSSAEYEGKIMSPGVGTEAKCEVAGHIPTAINVPWNLNCNPNGTFKAPDELHALYASFGVHPQMSVITYCAIGERASLSWFVLKHLLAYKVVMNYDRSMAQWSRMTNAPIETGEAA